MSAALQVYYTRFDAAFFKLVFVKPARIKTVFFQSLDATDVRFLRLLPAELDSRINAFDDGVKPACCKILVEKRLSAARQRDNPPTVLLLFVQQIF